MPKISKSKPNSKVIIHQYDYQSKDGAPHLRIVIEVDGDKHKPMYFNNPTTEAITALYKVVENIYGSYEISFDQISNVPKL